MDALERPVRATIGVCGVQVHNLFAPLHDPPTDPRTSTRKAALLEQRPYLSLQTSVNYVATRGAVPLMGIIVYLAGQRRPKTGKAALERP